MGNACGTAAPPTPPLPARGVKRGSSAGRVPGTPYVYAAVPVDAGGANPAARAAAAAASFTVTDDDVTPVSVAGRRTPRKSTHVARPSSAVAVRKSTTLEEQDIMDALVSAIAIVEAGAAPLEPQSPQSARHVLRHDDADDFGGGAAAAPPAARRRKRRSNSTSTLFITNTMFKPDDRAVLAGIAALVAQEMVPNPATPTGDCPFRMTAEQRRRLRKNGGGRDADTTMPSRGEIYAFMHHMFVRAQLEPDVPVMALVLFQRLLERPGVWVTPATWRHLVFGVLLLASKVWDDVSMTNESFAVVSPSRSFTLGEANALELAILNLVGWDVLVSGGEYARQYFRVRDAAASNEGLPTRQLDTVSASTLDLSDSRTSLAGTQVDGMMRIRRLVSADGGASPTRTSLVILS